MEHPSHLDWPFFEERHRVLAAQLETWATKHVPVPRPRDVDSQCRTLPGGSGEDTAHTCPSA